MLPSDLLDLWFFFSEGESVQRRILGLHDNPWSCDCQIAMVTSLSMSPGSPVVLMDRLLTCSGSPDQAGTPLTPARTWTGTGTGTGTRSSRCMRPSVQPGTTRVVSPLGSDVILRCDAAGYPTPTLSWVRTSAEPVCCRQDVLDDSEELPRNLESFLQESPRVGVRRSLISINALTYRDAGEYRCRARNMAGISEAVIRLKVVGVTRPSPPPRRRKNHRKPHLAVPAPSMEEDRRLRPQNPDTGRRKPNRTRGRKKTRTPVRIPPDSSKNVRNV